MIFILIVTLLFVIFMLLLWFNRPPMKKKTYRTVKAGQVGQAYLYPATIDKKDILKTTRLIVNNTIIDPNDYEIFIVNGNSMSNNGIKDGDGVLVKRLFGNDKYDITDFPILIFEIDINKDNVPCCIPPVEFKLRKFISYVDGELNFENWFGEIVKDFPELNDSKTILQEKFTKCIDKYKKNNNSDTIKLIMSSTLDTESGVLQYSFHPIKFLYGQVIYIIPSKAFE